MLLRIGSVAQQRLTQRSTTQGWTSRTVWWVVCWVLLWGFHSNTVRHGGGSTVCRWCGESTGCCCGGWAVVGVHSATRCGAVGGPLCAGGLSTGCCFVFLHGATLTLPP